MARGSAVLSEGAAQFPRSWYAATANPHPRYPELDGSEDCDIVVVGGGYTGLSAALELAGHGFRVVLLEAHRVGWGASGRNGGHIATGFNQSPSSIAALVGEGDARRLWAMGEEAKALLRDRVARHGIDCDLRWGYFTAALKPRHLRELAETVDEYRDRYGYASVRLVEGGDTAAVVDCPAYVGGMLDDGAGQLHPLNYALGLAAAAADAGVVIHEMSPVDRLEVGDRPVAVTARGQVRALYAVIAGNAYVRPLAAGAWRTMRSRIMPVGTYMIATEPMGPQRAASLIPGGVAVADANFVINYYRLSHDHRMLFGGGVNYSGVDRGNHGPLLRRTMLRYFPGLADLAVDFAWGGNVAITRNRLPQFGRIAGNVFFAQGFSGHGVALTGLAGALMAEAITTTAERFDVFARLPHRPFPGGRALRTPSLVLAMLWYRLRDRL